MRGRLQKANPITLFDLWIQVKDGPPINLGANLNEPQKIALDYLAPGWREGDYTLARGARLTFLKGRQEGMTTLILALCFCHVCNVSDQNAVFIADDASNSETAFGKIAYFWEHLPEEKRPKRKYSSRKELVLASNDSTFRILTAGAGRVGQSRTIHILHCSEVSNWPNAVETTPGLLQSIPSSGFIAFETTAKGDGEYDEQTNEYLGGKGAFFAVEYKRAKAGKNGYTAIFLPWHKMREYRRTPPEWYTQENLVSIEDNADEAPVERRRLYARFGDERSLVIRFGLDLHQLWWRRCKIEEPGMGLLMFRQEYPCDEEEAFAVSGQRFVPLFDTQPGGMHVVPYRSLEELTELYGAPDEIVGGYDWGKSSPYAFELIARWNSGIRRREILDECGGPNKTEEEHAAEIIKVLEGRGLKPHQVPIFCDPSIFGSENEKRRTGEYIEDKLKRGGLKIYRAINDRATTHPGVRDLVNTPGRLAIQVQCQGLITSLASLETDPKNPEFWVEGGKDHYPDAGVRYGCQSEIPEEQNKVVGINPAAILSGSGKVGGLPIGNLPRRSASLF
ncbi:hypothetical protein [Armatimonas rosea]|uniref:Phage terminase large subunit-like protein n=1 Tax=Armatimonas rosea TaxID=685828 RepID=A0A7W9SWH7_ARMRO|nr:hypothetical protein [Armatimonas rosea]MBB6053263.1 hypothetical protein [Armatimonas rosea]